MSAIDFIMLSSFMRPEPQYKHKRLKNTSVVATTINYTNYQGYNYFSLSPISRIPMTNIPMEITNYRCLELYGITNQLFCARPKIEFIY